MSVITIATQAEYDEKVLGATLPVLVDFWAPWCGPCKMVGPEVEAVANEFAGKAVVAKVNVDDFGRLAEKYSIRGVPTLLLIKDGQEVNRIVGYKPSKDIGAILQAAL